MLIYKWGSMKIFLLVLSITFLCCKEESEPEDEIIEVILEGVSFVPETTFDWDLRADIPADTYYEEAIVDLDPFDNSKALVQALHDKGRKVVAYISVGTVEDWREDADQFPALVIGNKYGGWDGERFLDIRNIELLAPIMRARLDMIKEKGFDAVEPDNIDVYANNSGFDISQQDVITYCNWLIEEAHSRGLSIGQKNATELVPYLVDDFDWILLEDAFEDDFYIEAQPYIAKNKAVFAVEYTDNMNAAYFSKNVCPTAKNLKYTAILKKRELNKYIVTCN